MNGHPLALPGMRIGLLGGSFDPAHDGHRSVSLTALKRMQLDAVWWLVSPGNPLKPEPTPLAERLAQSTRLARHPRIIPTDVETKFRTRFTIDTLRAIRRRWPDTHFVWIMGADNLGEIHRWKRWREIFGLVPVAVLDRPGYRLSAQASRAAIAFARYRIDEADAAALPLLEPPAWAFFTAPLSPLSSTAIRARHTATHSATSY